jgi:hypothetical protein
MNTKLPLLLCLVAVLSLLLATPAYAHLDGLGTSDTEDLGENIQVYKPPTVTFEGRFYAARMSWNALPGPPNFKMVSDPTHAEMIVYKGVGLCRGEQTWWSNQVDTLMITDGCHSEILQTVALHELGHSLGIAHHSCEDLISVMNECAGVPSITTHDIEAFAQIAHPIN